MKMKRTFSKSKQYLKRTIHRIKKAYKKTAKRMRKGMRNRLSSKRIRNTKRKKKRVLFGGNGEVSEVQPVNLPHIQTQGYAYRVGDNLQ